MSAFDPAPTSLDLVKSPEWLTAMLAQRWPGAVVRGVQTVETLVTMATKVRLRLEVEGGGEDVPTAICIKGVLTDTGLPTVASVVETFFYREAADMVGVRVPTAIHAGLSADQSNGVIVMRDVIAAGGQFCTALEPFTTDQARDGIDQLVHLHVAAPEGSTLYEKPWMHSMLDRLANQPVITIEALQALMDDPRGDPLPASVRSAGQLQRGLASLAEQVRSRPRCLIHGDAHAGNVYRDGSGALGVVDWQVLHRGDWAQDVAYHLAAVLTPEDRRANERALLDHYLGRLKDLGGPTYDREEAWTRYRAAMVYGYYMWAMTRKVDPVITYEFNRRLGLAVSELDSYTAAGI